VCDEFSSDYLAASRTTTIVFIDHG